MGCPRLPRGVIGRLACLFVFLIPVVNSSSSGTCRYPGDQECWPTPSRSDFKAISSQLSQPLIHPVPPATPCYPVSDPSGNCTEVLVSWGDGNWRSNHSGAMQSPNWETITETNGTIEACYPDTTLGFPCKQGNVPCDWRGRKVSKGYSGCR